MEKQTICANKSIIRAHLQDDSRNKGDDLRADVADSRKQAVMSSNR